MTDRRKALGLGLAASALALSGRGSARAADALAIDAGGVKIDKSLTVGSAATGGDVSVYGALTMNDKDIRLRSDEFHGLGFRKDFETIPLNGPVLWGYLGGALATQKTMALSWKAADVSVHGKLTVSGDAALKKSLTVDSDATLKGRVKITGANTLEFGANVPDKQVDAGKIGYGVWGKNDSLDIVGAGTKTGNGQDRKITFFAEGGAILKGWDSHPDLEVAGGQERLRMLRGIVDKDGNKTAGVGFDVKKQDGTSGTYQITFNPAFSSTPAASANQLALAESAYTTDSALIMEVSPGRMRVKTGGRYGDVYPRAFSFIVIGPR